MLFNVLIIDDNRANMVLIEHLLRKIPDCGSELRQDPADALAWCRSQIPDLVIVDYMMPGMDGIEFIRRFRELPGTAEIPILMVTANSTMDVRYEALEAGSNDFLTKPINKAEFVPRVKNMLALRRGQRLLGDRVLLLADEVRKATERLRESEREALFRLSKLAEYRDPETGAHILRMAHYSKHIAARLGMSVEEQDLILEAAPMHDIGKVGIPDEILLKPGKLTVEEFDIIKTHPLVGYEVLKGSSSSVLRAGAEIALSHHEKFDGTGYPSALKGEAIPLYGRIVAVADVFDALTSERPYKKAFDVATARNMIQEGDGKHFDPACVSAFLQNWDEVLGIMNKFAEEA